MAENAEILSNFIDAIATGGIRVVDLSHPLGPNTPMIKVPEGHGKNPPPVSLEYISNYEEDGGINRWSTLTTSEHAGTHFDTPSHWFTGRDYEHGTTDTIPVERFIAPVCVVDCTKEVEEDLEFVLTTDLLKDWESEYGEIPAGSWVLMRSGWAKRYSDPDAFLNLDETGYHSPGPGPDAVRYMIERDVCGFGTETVGTDHGNAGVFEPEFPAHYLLQGANKFGMSSLNNLDQLPPTGAIIMTAPLKIVNGSGSPLRVLAFVPKR
jgi:kynurenine formamidase